MPPAVAAQPSSGGAAGGTDDSGVSSRLAALKARLAAEKGKSSGRQAEIARRVFGI